MIVLSKYLSFSPNIISVSWYFFFFHINHLFLSVYFLYDLLPTIALGFYSFLICQACFFQQALHISMQICVLLALSFGVSLNNSYHFLLLVLLCVLIGAITIFIAIFLSIRGMFYQRLSLYKIRGVFHLVLISIFLQGNLLPKNSQNIFIIFQKRGRRLAALISYSASFTNLIIDQPPIMNNIILAIM